MLLTLRTSSWIFWSVATVLCEGSIMFLPLSLFIVVLIGFKDGSSGVSAIFERKHAAATISGENDQILVLC